MLVQRALRDGPFSMNQLAGDARVSYQSLRAWAAGIRTPERANIRKLAAAFRKRARALEKFADKLEREAARED